jgi:tRNA modification GTPase
MSMADTIYALASAPGKAGVAVLRLSGSAADTILGQVVKTLPLPRLAARRDIMAADGRVIDQGLVLRFKAPASYTGEDMVEFQLHGSRAVIAALSETLSRLGARLAEPGEFTRRAVMNGKLDLTGAEAVMDLIEADTEAQATQALRQLSGELKSLYDGWRQRLTRAQAHLEAAIDFADDDIPPALIGNVRAALSALLIEMQTHLEDARRGERLRDGVRAVIIGAPNAGKSSLLNRLAQREAAIVTAIPGTTRDLLDVALDVGGYPLLITDTAGLRDSADVIEQEGVRRALARAEDADFRILLCDATATDYAETLAHFRPGDLIVLNKSDLIPTSIGIDPSSPPPSLLGWGRLGGGGDVDTQQPISISALTGAGLPALLAALTDKAKNLAGLSPSPTLTRARHRDAVNETVTALTRALTAPALDQMAEDVRLSSRALGRITGQVGIEDLLDVIFRDFCLGK